LRSSTSLCLQFLPIHSDFVAPVTETTHQLAETEIVDGGSFKTFPISLAAYSQGLNSGSDSCYAYSSKHRMCAFSNRFTLIRANVGSCPLNRSQVVVHRPVSS
jgi:hypothetical protein